MTAIVRIDDEELGIEEFVRILKLTGRFETLLDEIVRDKLAVHAAKKAGVAVSAAEIQERADQFRRVLGLHRAADMNHYLDAQGVTLDEFEAFITDSLYQEKMMERVCRNPEQHAERLEFAYVEDAAHFITDDAPEAVAGLALDWFARAG